MNTSLQAAVDAIVNSNGGFFSVDFIKKDGTARTMNARLGVVKHLTGGVNTCRDKDYLLTAFDTQANGYRNINLTTITGARVGGEVFVVTQED